MNLSVNLEGKCTGFNPIPTGLGHVTLIYGLILPKAQGPCPFFCTQSEIVVRLLPQSGSYLSSYIPKKGPNIQPFIKWLKGQKYFMAIFVFLWSYLLTTKLSWSQRITLGTLMHTYHILDLQTPSG